MRLSTWLSRSLLALGPIAIAAACDDTASIQTTTLTLPDAGVTTIDAATSAEIDATVDSLDAGADAADAADASDASLTSYGGIVGTASAALTDDRCPAGQVMIGVVAGQITFNFYTGVISGLRTICGTPTLVPASGTISLGAGDTVPATARGAVAPLSSTNLLCPANEIVVGLTGANVVKKFPPDITLVATLGLRCAVPSYANGKVMTGAPDSTALIGTGGDVAVGPFDCPAGTVAVGTRSYVGDVINGTSAICEPLSL